MMLFFYTMIHFASKRTMQRVVGYFVLSNMAIHILVISLTAQFNSVFAIGGELAAVMFTVYLFAVRRSIGLLRLEHRGFKPVWVWYSDASWKVECAKRVANKERGAKT
jgi:hypothetical protein